GQPGGVGTGNGPDTEQDDQQGSGYPNRAAPQQGGQPVGQQAGRHQRRQGAQAEGRHQRSGQSRLALAAGPDQSAVDQPTGQPAPEGAQEECLGRAGGRQQSAGHALEAIPQTTPPALQSGDAGPPVGQIQTHGTQQQAGPRAHQGPRLPVLDHPSVNAEQSA